MHLIDKILLAGRFVTTTALLAFIAFVYTNVWILIIGVVVIIIFGIGTAAGLNDVDLTKTPSTKKPENRQ